MGTTRLSAEGIVGRGLSPEIWQANNFIGGNNYDPSLNGFFFDDFVEGTAWAEENTAKYQCLLQSGTITQSPDVDLSEGEWGVAVFTSDGTDNNQVSIQTGGAAGNLVKIDDATDEAGVVAFECRIQLGTVTNDDLRMFVGLAEMNKSINNGIISDTDDTYADVDHIGFTIMSTDGASLYRHFHKASGTLDSEDTGDDVVINTWIKLGFVYDPNAIDAEKIKFYVDGAECTNAGATRVTATDLADDTNFPAGEELAPIAMIKCGSGSGADTMSIDWWAVGQGFTG